MVSKILKDECLVDIGDDGSRNMDFSMHVTAGVYGMLKRNNPGKLQEELKLDMSILEDYECQVKTCHTAQTALFIWLSTG
jgi:hypothetical protein